MSWQADRVHQLVGEAICGGAIGRKYAASWKSGKLLVTTDKAIDWENPHAPRVSRINVQPAHEVEPWHSIATDLPSWVNIAGYPFEGQLLGLVLSWNVREMDAQYADPSIAASEGPLGVTVTFIGC